MKQLINQSYLSDTRVTMVDDSSSVETSWNGGGVAYHSPGGSACLKVILHRGSHELTEWGNDHCILLPIEQHQRSAIKSWGYIHGHIPSEMYISLQKTLYWFQVSLMYHYFGLTIHIVMITYCEILYLNDTFGLYNLEEFLWNTHILRLSTKYGKPSTK